jgi:rhamnogalacturonan endolyase
MKRVLSARRPLAPTLLLIAAAVAAGPSRLFAQAAPAGPVSVTEDQATYTLDNGTIRALISRKSGDLISMKYKGAEMLATFQKEDGTPNLEADPPGDPGRSQFGMTDHMYGFWSHDTIADRIESKITIDPKTNGGARAEISVKGFSDGKKLGHGPGAPPDGDFAADIEIRYTLGQGDSGVYTYCIFNHKPEYPDATLGEARFCAKLNSSFDWMLVDAHHNLYYPPEPEANGWDDKYNYTTVQWEHPAFGWASVTKNVGFFIVNPSVEYLTGPPTKVEFLCHRDTNQIAAPCVLNYWRSSHYGGGGVDAAKGEAWTKVIGPFLLYCNTGNNPQTIWADANAQQKRESAKWPYDWVVGVDYPVKAQRSTVTGHLNIRDPQMPPGATISNIRVGLSAPDYTVTTGRPAANNAPSHITWQTDSKHYEFWVRADNSGSFSIPAVRAGTYTLHAIADGVLGEFAKTDVTVEAGKPLDLGTLDWTPVRKGRQLWEIGIPNRSGSEFAGGDDYFHDGMGMIYALRFPDDIDFTIGKSDFHKDWFYLQVPHATDAAIAAATVDAQPRPARGRGGFGGRGATTRAGARGPAATGPQELGAGRGGPGRGRGARGGIARGGGPGRGGPGGAPQTRATPWTISFDLPSAPRGKVTLRVAIATSNTREVSVAVNQQEAGRLDQLPTDSAIGRNGIQGIWFERDLAFDAGLLKQGTNTLTLIVPPGGATSGLIYDYLRLELDDSAPAQ